MEVTRKMLNLKETELCLGLPGGRGGDQPSEMTGLRAAAKRGFSETVDLKLNIQSKDDAAAVDLNENVKNIPSNGDGQKSLKDPAKPPAK